MGKNVAVFVDVANIFYAAKAAGVDIDYVTLLKSATAGRDLVRAYAYTGLDPDNENQRNFHDFLRRSNYKVVSKDIRKYGDGKVKANLDIELVVDMMKTARNLDIAIVVSGDGDFAPAIRAVQEMGVRCEVISFRGNTSSDLIEVADQFTDIIQLARVEKGSRSGRRVAEDDADLSMTEVPDKLTEGTGAGRGGRGRGRGRARDEEPASARAVAVADRPRAAGAPAAAGGGPGGAARRAPGARRRSDRGRPRRRRGLHPRRRRRRTVPRVSRTRPIGTDWARTASRVAAAAAAVVAGVAAAAGARKARTARRPGGQDARTRESRRKPERRSPRHRGPGASRSPRAATWSRRTRSCRPPGVLREPPRSVRSGTPSSGTPTAPAASLAPIVDDDEDFDEPEIPEYLIAEQRRGANRGGGRGARGGRSAYQSAMERERFGRGGAPAGGGGGGGQRSPGRGINRYPDVSARPRPAGPAREERGYGRQERSSVPPPPRGSSEPWSDVPPELEALLRAQVAQKPGPRPAPARGGRVERDAPGESAEQVEPAVPAETAAAKPRAARKPSTRSRAAASAPEAGAPATATPDVADPAAVADVSAPAPKRRTTRTSKTAAVAEAAPAVDEGRGSGCRAVQGQATRDPQAVDVQDAGSRRRFGRRRSGERARRQRRHRRRPSAGRRARRRPPNRPDPAAPRRSVNGARTRGQAAALAAIAAMVRGQQSPARHPAGRSGRRRQDHPGARPRGRTAVRGGTGGPAVPGLPRLPHGRPTTATRTSIASRPAGPGRQVVIGGPEARYRGVRDLIAELALMPVEGRCPRRHHRGRGPDERGCPVGPAQDPRGAPGGRRHRPVRRPGDAAPADGPLALRPDPARAWSGRATSRRSSPTTSSPIRPLAARLGRLAAGRPGLALAYARAPEAVLIRAELSRVLLDLTGAGVGRPAGRGPAGRPARDRARRGTRRRRRRRGGRPEARQATRKGGRRRRAAPAVADDPDGGDRRGRPRPGDGSCRPRSGGGRPRSSSACGRTSPATWRSSAAGGGRSVRDPVLLEELTRDRRGGRPGGRRRASSIGPRAAPSCSPRTCRPSCSSTRWRSPGRAARGRLTAAMTVTAGRHGWTPA